jgi:hypothetical protein
VVAGPALAVPDETWQLATQLHDSGEDPPSNIGAAGAPDAQSVLTWTVGSNGRLRSARRTFSAEAARVTGIKSRSVSSVPLSGLPKPPANYRKHSSEFGDLLALQVLQSTNDWDVECPADGPAAAKERRTRCIESLAGDDTVAEWTARNREDPQLAAGCYTQ